MGKIPFPVHAPLLLILVTAVFTMSPDAQARSGKTTKTDSISKEVSVAVQVHPSPRAKTSPDKAIRQAVDEARRLYKDLDRESSGEVGRINKGAGKDRIKVSGGMLTLLRVCMQISEWTQGLFDVVRTPGKKPGNLEVNFASREVKLKERKSWLDFGPIRNGYVIDRMAGALKSQGYSDFMIQSGAVVRTMGKDGKDYWRLNIADSGRKGKQLCRVSLESSSVATADLRMFPKSIADLRSVTVITRNATNATALANTALYAGKDRARGMLGAIREPGFGAILEDRDGKIHIVGDVTAACFQE